MRSQDRAFALKCIARLKLLIFSAWEFPGVYLVFFSTPLMISIAIVSTIAIYFCSILTVEEILGIAQHYFGEWCMTGSKLE